VVAEFIGYQPPDVENIKLPNIQKGLEYCKGHEFYTFDHVLSNNKKETQETTESSVHNDEVPYTSTVCLSLQGFSMRYHSFVEL